MRMNNPDNRLAAVNSFYELLEVLKHRNGVRHLCECHGRMPWPQRGVYFFFEEGESRSTGGGESRDVRVGAHAVSAGSSTTLWQRLSQHRGSSSLGGNHRGSIFRLLVGQALAARYPALATAA